MSLSSSFSVSGPTPIANRITPFLLAASAAFRTSSWDFPSVRTTAILETLARSERPNSLSVANSIAAPVFVLPPLYSMDSIALMRSLLVECFPRGISKWGLSLYWTTPTWVNLCPTLKLVVMLTSHRFTISKLTSSTLHEPSRIKTKSHGAVLQPEVDKKCTISNAKKKRFNKSYLVEQLLDMQCVTCDKWRQKHSYFLGLHLEPH